MGLNMALERVGVCLALASLVAADLPNHCLNSDVQGKWKIFKTQPSYTKDNAHQSCANAIKGNLDNSLTREFTLDLNTVTDHTNNDEKGSWTMIYDEGFELTVSGKKYFAFSKYKYKGMFTSSVDNMCDRTLPGTYHDTKVKGEGQ